MDRTAWIAVVCCIIALVGWQYYFSKTYPPIPAPASTPAPAVASATPAPGASPIVTPVQPDAVAASTAGTPAAAPTPAVEAKTEVVATPQIKLTFTNLGGGIAEAEPLGKEHLAENGLNIALNHAGPIPSARSAPSPARTPHCPTPARATATPCATSAPTPPPA